MTEEQRARLLAWKVAVVRGRRCVHCGKPAQVAHHAPRRQVIERRLGGDPWDPRCGVPLCDPCHELHHAPGVAIDRRVRRSELPDSVWAFVRDLGEPAVVALEREYPT